MFIQEEFDFFAKKNKHTKKIQVNGYVTYSDTSYIIIYYHATYKFHIIFGILIYMYM